MSSTGHNGHNRHNNGADLELTCLSLFEWSINSPYMYCIVNLNEEGEDRDAVLCISFKNYVFYRT